MELPKISLPANAEHHRTLLPCFHLVWMALTADSTSGRSVSTESASENRDDYTLKEYKHWQLK